MRIGIATDHGGFSLKQDLVAQLRAAGHEVVDFGAHALSEGDDYPDYVLPLARAVAASNVERGVASAAAASARPCVLTRCAGFVQR
jgi:ribose 5-phosphate isomerase B